jgi:hypothetical protein
MKRTIAGMLLMLGLSAGTLFAEDGWRDRRHFRNDEARIQNDQRELQRDQYYGNYAAAEHERRELRNEYRDVDRDRRESYWNERRESNWDRR